VHYFDNGTIAPVRIDATGVGEYDGRRRVQAEDFFALSGGGRQGHDSAGAFGVHDVRAGTVLSYPRIRGVPAGAALTVRGANGGSTPTEVTAWRGRAAAPGDDGGNGAARAAVLCTLTLPPTGGWEVFVTARCALPAAQSVPSLTSLASAGEADLDLLLTFERNGGGGGGATDLELARLDWLAFEPAAE
jgi:hypothetical protein